MSIRDGHLAVHLLVVMTPFAKSPVDIIYDPRRTHFCKCNVLCKFNVTYLLTAEGIVSLTMTLSDLERMSFLYTTAERRGREICLQ